MPLNNTLIVQLLLDGTPVPGFETIYTGGQSGIRRVLAGPKEFRRGHTFDLRFTISGSAGEGAVDVSATVGIE